MIVQVLNFLILMWLLKKLLYGPVIDYLDRRSEGIKVDLSEAKRMKKEATEVIKNQELEYQRAKREAQNIVREAQKQAESEKNKILADAEEESHQIVENGKKFVDMELRTAKTKLHNNVIDIATAIAGQMIEQQITVKDQDKLLKKALEQFDQWN
jgi:F-type H+-transporting ATPase subunit b